MPQIAIASHLSDQVEYLAYDTNLPSVFEKVKGIIQQSLANVSVEHVGSSSIPGIGGRNVLDIVVLANSHEQDSVRQNLLSIGFQPSPFQHYLPLLVGEVADNDKGYTLLTYVLSADHPVYKGWIEFRDYMRNHPLDAQAYDQIKRQCISEGNDKSDSYQDAKTPFLESMIEKIQSTAQSQNT